MPKKDDHTYDENNTQPEETLAPMDKDEPVVSHDDISAAAEAEEAHSDDSEGLVDLDESQETINALTEDLQRTRADFENYQKRTAQEKETIRAMATKDTVAKLLPIIDIIEQAASHLPKEIADTPFGKGMSSIEKKLEKQLKDLNVEKLTAKAGDKFNPELHNAVQVDEDAEGETEVLADVMQAGYKKDGQVIRYAMVRVTREQNKQTNQINTPLMGVFILVVVTSSQFMELGMQYFLNLSQAALDA